MSEEQEPVLEPEDKQDAGTDLVVKAALDTYLPLQSELDELHKRFGGVVFDLTTVKGDKEARAARAELVSYGPRIDDAYKNWNQPRLQAAKRMREVAEDLKKIVTDLKNPIEEQIVADEARRETARVEKKRIEDERIGSIRKRITALQALMVTMLTESSEKIQASIDFLATVNVEKSVFEEFTDEAIQVVGDVRAGLGKILETAKQRETQARELEEARKAAEEKAKQDEVDRLKRAEEDRLAEVERKRQADVAAAEAARMEEQRKAEESERVAAAQKVAEEHQAMLKKQTDAFAEEKAVANKVAVASGAVARAALMTSSSAIRKLIQDVSQLGESASTDELSAQIAVAKKEALEALDRLEARAKEDERLEDERIAAAAAAEEKAKNDVADKSADDAPNKDFVPVSDDVQAAVNEANAQHEEGRDLGVEAFDGGEPEVTGESVAFRPSDATILHSLATTFGVSEAEALDWLEDIDLFELKKHVEMS